MSEKKLTLKEIERAIQEKKDFLVTEMTKLWEVFEPISEELALQAHEASGEILELFQQKKSLEADQKIQEENQKFLAIEKDVLTSLPQAEQIRMAAMRTRLHDNYQDRYETSYRQAIMKLHNQEVVIKPDSVQFLYVHQELDRQELQLPDGKDIMDYTYEWFAGEQITRREIRQKVLDKDHPSNHIAVAAFEKAKSEVKQLATEENTFTPILDGFSGDVDQKIKAMQFLTWFMWRWIISLEKDENGSRRFLGCGRGKDNTGVRGGRHPVGRGALLLSKDC